MSSTNNQCNTQLCFMFAEWSSDERENIDRELKECTSLPFVKLCTKIAALLPNKSVRDVAIHIKWLIKQGTLDNIWNEAPQVEESGESHNFTFYLPDRPGEPDLLAILNGFSARAAKHNSG